MRRLFSFVLVLFFLLTCGTASAQATEEIIRLHVIADNDTKEAQEMKLKVRDSVRRTAEEITRDAQTPGEALYLLKTQAGLLRASARRAALNEGYEGKIVVKVGMDNFPAKRYGAILLKAGEYQAVRVEIGNAAGRNWWCVIYPSLCYYGDSVESGKVYFYSSLKTWLFQIFQGGKDE